jgi:enolase
MIMVRGAIPPVTDDLASRAVLDSRGNPTIEIDVDGKYRDEVTSLGRSPAPAGRRSARARSKRSATARCPAMAVGASAP